MFNEKGQAFDAFKLLIAAVVAGSILVIIISILDPGSWFFTDPANEANTLISRVKDTPGYASRSNEVTFSSGDIYFADGWASKAQLNDGAILFCVGSGDTPEPDIFEDSAGNDILKSNEDEDDACPSDYVIDIDDDTPFEDSKDDGSGITLSEDIGGKLRAYRTLSTDKVKVYIGFKAS